MFFRRKCPSCGTKNPKESDSCFECGAVLASRQVKEQKSQRVKVRNIIIDKSTKSIITRRKFIFFGKRRIIPFSDVIKVHVLLYKRREDLIDTILKGMWYLGPMTVYNHWETFLELSGRKHPDRLRIAVSKNLKDMVYLTNTIEKFLGRK